MLCLGTPRCSSNYDEETNNNQVLHDSDSEIAQDDSAVSWEGAYPKEPGTPTYIAKDSTSLTFQWQSVQHRGKDSLEYSVEMQPVLSDSAASDSSDAIFIESDKWNVVYSGKECWTQVKDLMPGGYYAVRIRSCVNSHTKSDYTSVVIFHTTPSVPSAPQPPELTQLGCDCATLEWNEPLEDGGSRVTAYRLQISPPPGPLSDSQGFEDVFLGLDLKFKIDNLSPFVKYTSRVKVISDSPPMQIYVSPMIDDLAINEVGEGQWSLTSTFKTEPSLPEKPTGLSANLNSPFFVTLAWSPTVQRAIGRDMYEVEIVNLETSLSRIHCVGHQTFHSVYGLELGYEHQFRVRSINDVGQSEWSDPITLYVPPQPPLPPSAPFPVLSSKGEVRCRWYPPQLPGGRDPLQFQLELAPLTASILEGFALTWRTGYSGQDLDCTLTDLTPGGEYYVRVKAKNEAGWSLPSPLLHLKAQPDVPQSPPVPHAQDRSNQSLRVYWATPNHDGGCPIYTYRLQICQANQLSSLDNSDPFMDVYEGAQNSADLKNLIPGSVYALRVCAINDVGASEWSDVGYESTQPGRPLPPQDLNCINRGAHGLRLKWSPPSANGGSAVSRYILAVKDGDDLREVYKDAFTECTISNLIPGKAYIFRVKAVTDLGESEWSEAIEAHTHSNLPAAPKSIMAMSIQCSRIELEWDHEDNDLDFVLEARLSEGPWTERYRGKTKSCLVDGLLSGEEYSFRVAAVGQGGIGQYKQTTLMTDSLPPEKPGALCVTHVTSSVVRLKWDVPESNGKRILRYKIEIEGSDGSLYERVLPVSLSSAKIGDLTERTSYNFRLSAENEVGSSKWSEPVSVKTRPAPPAVPVEVKAVVSDQTVGVSWNCAGLTDDLVFEVQAFYSTARKSKNQSPVLTTEAKDCCCCLRGLENGQKYEVFVRAKQEGIASKWSQSVAFKIPEVAATMSNVVADMGPSTTKKIRNSPIVQPKLKNPLKKRKTQWRSVKFYSRYFFFILVALMFLVLVQQT